MPEIKLIKKYASILFLFFVSTSFAQNEESVLEFEIPHSFFNEMFRNPTDKYLVAWSGGVTVIVKNKSGQEIQVAGVIETVEDFLNTELTNLGRRQFKYNLNTPIKRVSTPNDKSWAGHCGYNPYKNITFSDIQNGKPSGWPSEITSEVWGLHLSKKTSKTGTYKNSKTGVREVVSVYFYANSIFYYHKIKPQSLKGKVTRDDNYKACGKIAMYRLGPGYSRFKKFSDVTASEFEFTDKLFLGDYQVQYIWPDGTFQILEEHIVYDPFGNPEILEYELETFEGEISGTLIDKETHKPVKNQKVKLQPVCTDSGLPKKETKSDGDGKFKFTEVPQGVYNIVTKGVSETEAALTKNPNLRVGEILVKKNSKYDIYATYTAPGFAKATLVWRNATIKFPEDDEPIPFFDMIAYRNSGAYDEPIGTDGRPLQIPFSIIIPGIGKKTLYGGPESETATPEVISVTSLGGKKVFTEFKIVLTEDALNSCDISRNNNGPIFLNLGFDLTGRYIRSDVWQQVNVTCIEDKEYQITKGASLNGYPVTFRQYKFSDEEIEKFKEAEEFNIILSGRGATLKIEFKPLEE